MRAKNSKTTNGNPELIEALEAIAREKDISKEVLLEAIQNSLLAACKDQFGKSDNIRVVLDETTGELWERLSKIGGNLLVETLKEIEKGIAPREKQGNDYTLAPMLNKEMAKIDWENKTAEEIKNLVRGLNPIMGAYTFLNGKKIKFWKVSIATEDELITDNIEIMRNGTVIISDQKDGLFIKAKNGILKVLEIQGENAKKMSIGDFLRGNQIQEFDVFE